MILTTVAIGWVLGRRLWFYADDWNILASYHNGRLLEPFNSHLSLVPAGIYQLLFHTVGLGSYAAYRVVGLVAYAIFGLAVLRYVRGRVVGIGAVLAVGTVLWNAGASTSLMFPFLMNYSLPLAAMAGMWWHFDQARPRSDWWASAWLTFALATSGMGLLCAIAAGTELLVTRSSWRRWLVLSPGPVLWFAWYLRYGEPNPPLKNVGRVTTDTLEILWGGCASLVGGNKPLGLVVAGLICALAVASIWKWKTWTARATAGTTAIVAFAVLTAISRNREHAVIRIDEPRYTWTVGVLLVLTCVSLMPRSNGGGSPVALLRPAQRVPMLAGLALTALTIALVVNVGVTIRDSRRWTDSVAQAAPGVRDNLAAAEEADRNGTLDQSRVLPLSFNPVTAAQYMNAVRNVGSPLEGSSPEDFGGIRFLRRVADQTLDRDFGFVAEAITVPLCAGAVWSEGAHMLSGETVEIAPDNDAVEVHISRFAPRTDAQITRLLPEQRPVRIRIPDTMYGPKYRVEISGKFQARVCK